MAYGTWDRSKWVRRSLEHSITRHAPHDQSGRAGRAYSEWVAALARELRDVLGRRALLALHRVELDAIAFGEGLEPAALNRRMMDEQILRSVFGRDEPETLVVVEPLHCACRTHCRTPYGVFAVGVRTCRTYRLPCN